MDISRDTKIGDLVDKHLLRQQNREHKGSGKWKPSNFGRCYRYQYWVRVGETVTNPVPANTLRVFAIGKMIHSWLQDIIGRYEYSIIESLIDVDEVKAFVDVVGIDEIIEIKSVRSFGFRVIKKDEFVLDRDKQPELLQATYYALKKGKEFARLIFVDKDTLEFQEFVVKIAPYLPMLTEEFENLNSYWDMKKLPPALPRAYKGKECAYCGFSDKCKGGKQNGSH